MKPFRLLLAGVLFPLLSFGHIGSPTVVTEGPAGPYQLRVVVRPPAAIPGQATVDIRFLDTPLPVGAKVFILPVSGANGLKSAPAPDETSAVPGDPAQRHGELWLMTTGAYSVHVDVSGPAGQGRLIVPFESIATQTPSMGRGFGAALLAAGVLLVASGVTLAGSGLRQSLRPVGVPPHPENRRTGWWAVAVAIVAFCFVAVWIKRWWGYEEWMYRNKTVFRPIPLEATASMTDGASVVELRLKPRDPDAPVAPLLLPDHGKLMHLFAIREPELDAFAHLHPLQSKPGVFQVAFPPLPPGTYRLFADITYEDGFAATLTDTIKIPGNRNPTGPAATVAIDPDDSWFFGNPPPDSPARAVTIEPVNPSTLRAGEPVVLSFRAVNIAHQPLGLSPYLGMAGHAAVRRDDGAVFAHLHPSGTISMAAQKFFEREAVASSAPAHVHSMSPSDESLPPLVSFPFEFPSAGNYRVWVQLKVAGVVQTAAFDFKVLGR